MTKRLISFLLVLCLLLTWLPRVHAEEDTSIVPEGAVEFNGNHYMVYHDSMTWTEAAAKCEEMGGRLVTITSQTENNFVAELLADAQKNCYWIGIQYDLDNGLWIWSEIKDGSKVASPAPYFNWAPNEPNFFGDQDEPYVHMFGKRHTGGNGLKEVGQWNDVSNEGAVYAHSFYDLKNFGYICEWGEEKIVDLDDYVEFQGHYYQIYNHAPDWFDANEYCKALGGHLATITSQEENDFLYQLMKSRGVSEAYFGYTDEADEGNWVWVTGETSDYTNWHTGEPSNSSNKEHYGMFYKDFKDGTWNDSDFPRTAVYFFCEWDKELENEDLLPERLPSEYDFNLDSLSFHNYSIPNIDQKYFTTLFEPGAAKIFSVEKKDMGSGGVCCGMTYVTGAIYQGYPSATSFYNLSNTNKTYCTSIRDLTPSSMTQIGNITISLNDYITYAHIYQWSSKHRTDLNNTLNNTSSLLAATRIATRNNQLHTIIRFDRWIPTWDKKSKIHDGAHYVLGIGTKGRTILTDDPNHTDIWHEIVLLEEPEWRYTGSNRLFFRILDPDIAAASAISYTTDVTMPYHILLTGKYTTGYEVSTTSSTDEVIPKIFVEGMERVDADKMLLSVESGSYQLANTDICQISRDSAAETADLFWISNDDTITLSGLEGESTVRLASDDLLIGVEAGSGGDVTMTNTGTTSDITLSTAAGDSCTFTVETTGTNEEDVILVVSGTAADTTITLHQNDSQVTVEGLENGTVSVYEDEQPVREEPLPQDGGEIDIVYDPTGETDDLEISGTVNPFTDVEEGRFYYEPVLWAVGNGITYGLSDTEFGTEESCKRSHVVTFLHRAAGNPAPSSTKNPFTDVKTGDFFYNPVLWAVEKGITNGVSGNKFGSYDVCNRAAVVTFLWRAAGSPEPNSTKNPFTDVKAGDFFYKPVLWAVEKGITNGLSATEFGPNAPCNRAQVVTFLYRAYN